MRAKAILLIGDGLADRPCPELAGLTPLEAAKSPHLDQLATEGECGLLDPIAPGIPPGSDTAHLAFLGYDPYEDYPGRGPFEAAGIGMDVQPSDIAFRCNFATIDEHNIVVDRRAGRIRGGTADLAAALDGLEIDGVCCFFRASVEHRAALVLRGEGLGDQVTDPDPKQDGKPLKRAEGKDAASARTAAVVNAFIERAHEILSGHPVNEARAQAGEPLANLALPRGAGRAPHLRPFSEHSGLNGALVVEVALVKGIGRYVGMTVVDVPGASGNLATDEVALAQAAGDALADHDFVLCNLKCADVWAHDGDPEAKVTAVEKLDRMAEVLLGAAAGEQSWYLVVTGDHTTACAIRDHTGEPVPVALWGPDVRSDAVTTFGERSCATGGLGRLRGRDLLPVIISYLGAAQKFGA